MTISAITAITIFLAVRLISVYLVQTWYVPDEYWQSLEVAHKFVFNYGYLTWEWKEGIRSYIHPLIIAFVYKFLSLFNLDYADALIIIPRILQALLSAYSDYSFWKWCGRTKWSVFCIGSSWFWFYTGSRTLLNTLETSLTTIALSKFPFQNQPNLFKTNNTDFLWIVGLVCAVRPTAIIIWFPLTLYHLFTSRERIIHNLIVKYLPAIIITLGASCLLDSVAHGSFVLTWWNFLKFNLFDSIGEWYGAQPWHWYLSNGLPAILGIQLLPFLISSFKILRYREMFVDEIALLATITFSVTIYSFLGHKEFRFLLPLLPIALKISAQYLTNWSRKASDLMLWIVAIVLLIGNVIPATYLSILHQRGNLDVMTHLREISASNPSNTSLLFLMPCHSTPLYSHLHVNITARFLTCNPNLAKLDKYVDEADYFYKSPNAWIRNNYPSDKPLPSHIISFDTLIPHISDILSRYKPIERIYNTNIGVADQRIGRFVTVHERIDV